MLKLSAIVLAFFPQILFGMYENPLTLEEIRSPGAEKVASLDNISVSMGTNIGTITLLAVRPPIENNEIVNPKNTRVFLRMASAFKTHMQSCDGKFVDKNFDAIKEKKANRFDAITLIRNDVAEAVRTQKFHQLGDNIHVSDLDISFHNLKSGDIIGIFSPSDVEFLKPKVLLVKSDLEHIVCGKVWQRCNKEE